MGDAILFEDIFTITAMDPEGKKFDKGERSHGARLMLPADFSGGFKFRFIRYALIP